MFDSKSSFENKCRLGSAVDAKLQFFASRWYRWKLDSFKYQNQRIKNAYILSQVQKNTVKFRFNIFISNVFFIDTRSDIFPLLLFAIKNRKSEIMGERTITDNCEEVPRVNKLWWIFLTKNFYNIEINKNIIITIFSNSFDIVPNYFYFTRKGNIER